MGFSEKAQNDGGFESDTNRKWVIAGIALRAPLKPLYTIPVEKVQTDDHINGDVEECSTTPTGEESRIKTTLTCPPAPRKRKPSLNKFNYGGSNVREFFNPPDLETVFIRHIERAN
ncbi:Cyclin-dependent protein kinase inhibitor SMR6 [Quillaja saponaria]|uniref:Cyclin-dependent protein kinase inhibitor SMR6 n=1 Tax=Quillaja saponaria TaxID=32244 RepID=A0AAD7LA34_QUISA|nr:Cyclin-dependent protein kinase inhibitor SMR6 [Quillaja saponaria]